MKDSEIEKIKREILGEAYELSFSFVSSAKIKSLNNKYRKINKPTDILSFPLDENTGEILICKEIAKVKSKEHGLSPAKYLLFLTIHGCLHLKGFDHGPAMEKLEKKYMELFCSRK